MNDFPRIEASIYGEPWAITQGGFATLNDVFNRHKTGAASDWLAAYKAASDAKEAAPKKRYDLVNGVAVVPISGPIFPKANLMTALSGATSLQAFMGNMRAAMADPEVRAVVMSVDSPGGMVSGVAEAADELRSMRSKPVWSVASPLAASAAYWLASQAQRMVATRGATVGSIGVIGGIQSTDRMERNEGIDSIIVTTGEKKLPSLNPVTTASLESMRDRIEAIFAMFKEDIRAGRPGMDVDRVATGETWVGARAMDLGLVDAVGTLDEVISILSRK